MEQLMKDVRSYVDLRMKRFKLGVVEKLATVFGNTLSLVAFILLLGMAMLLFSGALTVLISKWVGSLVWAFVIMGGVYLIVALVFFFMRHTLFLGSMVSTFSRIFFGNKTDDDEEDEEEEHQ